VCSSGDAVILASGRTGVQFEPNSQCGAGEIIEVSREEAEWTLDVVDDLFDYFIVGPERDKARRADMDKKLKKAGRRAIEPPSSEN
jgi:hypothetical protein